jgi:Domain of unknown function (DUF4471)
MLEKRNGKYQYTSQTIQEFNIKRIIEKFRDLKYGQSLPLDHVSIEFLPCDPDQTLKKLKYVEKFGLVYISFDLSHRVGDVYPLVKVGGKVLVEDCEYYIGLSEEQKVAYRENVGKLAVNAGLKPFKDLKASSDTGLLFVK